MADEDSSLPLKPSVRRKTHLGYFNWVALYVFPFLLSRRMDVARSCDKTLSEIRWIHGNTFWFLILLFIWSLAIFLETWRRYHHSDPLVKRWTSSLVSTFKLNLPGLFLVFGLLAESGWVFVYLFFAILAVGYYLSEKAVTRSVSMEKGGETEKFIKKVLFILPFIYICFLAYSSGLREDCEGKTTTVKANMQTFQTLVETYAVENKGRYPQDITRLELDAKKKEYWKMFINPSLYQGALLEKSGPWMSYADYDGFIAARPKPFISQKYMVSVLGIQLHVIWDDPQPPYSSGMVLYKWVSSVSYAIYGTDDAGQLIQDKGQTLWLSNS